MIPGLRRSAANPGYVYCRMGGGASRNPSLVIRVMGFTHPTRCPAHPDSLPGCHRFAANPGYRYQRFQNGQRCTIKRLVNAPGPASLNRIRPEMSAMRMMLM